ncbi:MAG: sulfide/dihydroorotate dehydrogenase-like FAD/NAD-binding protein [Bacteroidota bacterium]|nr:sulfide/dihydroorotate dehydrogenase-like FAD/NAD-binding protein [Bacteroidota bacterium]
MFVILEKKRLNPDVLEMKVSAPRVAEFAQPGQFVIVIPDKTGERVPLTICDYDRKAGSVTIVFQVVGLSTRKMARLEKGDAFADFVGPLGKSSELISESPEELSGKNILFIAGGVGAAPIYPQMKWLNSHGKKADLILGARDAGQLILVKELKENANKVFITTNDGSAGTKGFVTGPLNDLLLNRSCHYDRIIAIGPLIMMKSVADLTRSFNVKTIVSLNPLMIDGTGMCGACRVTIGNQTKFTCVDGPEFDGHLVNFEEAMRRQAMYKPEEKEHDHLCNMDLAVEESHSKSLK